MKQAFTRLYILLAILISGASLAWADEVTFTTNSNGDISSNKGATKNGITITLTDGVSYNNPNSLNGWATSYCDLRAKGTISVSPGNATITKIVLKCTGDNNESSWSSSIGEVPTVDTKNHIITWNGSTAAKITLTNTGTSTGLRSSHISSITVTYTPLTPRNINATINAYGYATFSCDYETTVPNGVTAYTGTVDENAKTITWTAIADGIIPANEGVLLKGTASTTATLTESYTSKTKIEGNQLIANITEKTKAELGNYIYVLSGSEIVRLSDSGKLKANRAYFSMKTDIAATGATMRMIWNDAGATIIDVANTNSGRSICYNLNGQRVNVKGVKRNAKGIVIVNGKKVIQ